MSKDTIDAKVKLVLECYKNSDELDENARAALASVKNIVTDVPEYQVRELDKRLDTLLRYVYCDGLDDYLTQSTLKQALVTLTGTINMKEHIATNNIKLEDLASPTLDSLDTKTETTKKRERVEHETLEVVKRMFAHNVAYLDKKDALVKNAELLQNFIAKKGSENIERFWDEIEACNQEIVSFTLDFLSEGSQRTEGLGTSVDDKGE